MAFGDSHKQKSSNRLCQWNCRRLKNQKKKRSSFNEKMNFKGRSMLGPIFSHPARRLGLCGNDSLDTVTLELHVDRTGHSDLNIPDRLWICRVQHKENARRFLWSRAMQQAATEKHWNCYRTSWSRLRKQSSFCPDWTHALHVTLCHSVTMIHTFRYRPIEKEIWSQTFYIYQLFCFIQQDYLHFLALHLDYFSWIIIVPVSIESWHEFCIIRCLNFNI